MYIFALVLKGSLGQIKWQVNNLEVLQVLFAKFNIQWPMVKWQ